MLGGLRGVRVISAAVVSSLAMGLASAPAGIALAVSPAITCPSVDPTTGAVSPAPVEGIDWAGCDLEKANLAGADLFGANFHGTDLKGADLSGANLKEIGLGSADLSNANLTNAVLQQAILSDAIMAGATLTGVSSGFISGSPASLPDHWMMANNYLVGPGANLKNANLTATELANADLANADLTNANLAQADLTGASLAGTKLTGVISGKITGSPTLPANWSLINGYLLGPGADLSSADLTNQNLAGLHLTGANLNGAALTGSNLTNANLENAILTGAILKNADLTGATLTGVTSAQITGTPSALPANWVLLGGYLIGPGADLKNANLVSFTLSGDDMSGADLSGADLVNADLTHANLSDADLATASVGNAVLTGANLSGATATTAVFGGSNLTNVNFDGADLTDADLADVNLSGANLANSTLTGVAGAFITGTPSALPSGWLLRGGYLIGLDASLMDADLNSLNLDGANLTGATLVAATFEHTKLVNAILSGANLTSANLSFANLTGANLTNADLESANFSFANLTRADLHGATTTNGSFPQVTWNDTTCPDGTNSNEYVDGCFSPVDTQAPVAHPTVSGTLGSNGWYLSEVTVSWNWTDNGTINPAKCTHTSSSATNGSADLTASCTDLAGNTGSGSENVKIDTTAPQVKVTGVRNGGVYPLGRVPAIACQTTDSVSGIAKAAVLKVTSSGAGGVGSFTASCGGAVSVAGATQPRTVSVSYTVEYGFAGFIAPHSGATVAKSSRKILVRFRLDNGAGHPIGNSLGRSLARQHRVRVSISGPRIKVVTALCGWDSAHSRFECALSIPSGVKTGSRADYAIAASEKLSAQFKVAPAVGAAVNPEEIHFR